MCSNKRQRRDRKKKKRQEKLKGRMSMVCVWLRKVKSFLFGGAFMTHANSKSNNDKCFMLFSFFFLSLQPLTHSV